MLVKNQLKEAPMNYESIDLEVMADLMADYFEADHKERQKDQK